MNILTYSLQIFAGMSMLLLALAIVAPPQAVKALRSRSGTSPWVHGMAAILSGLAGLGLFVAVAVPFLAFFAAGLAVVITIAVIITLITRGALRYWPAPVAILAASIGVALCQPLGLQVLSLPKADSLPYRPIPARVIKTYAEGVWFESVRAGPDGTLYLAANRNLDFSVSDYYRNALGQVIARRPDGYERVILNLPKGSTAGAFAIAADATIYMASNGRTPGIWRILPDGEAKIMTQLPPGAWPNGLDFGPDGMLYSSDSALGLIWRVDPHTGQAERVIESKILSARPFISLAPGANGLRFHDRDMFVTVSDSTSVLRYSLGSDGNFGPPAIIGTGIPGDDFAIGKDGALFITTHPYNTLVRIAPDGARTIVANANQHIVGATDAAFGRGEHDQDTLYVVTDGGAFTGGSHTRGELIELKPYAQP